MRSPRRARPAARAALVGLSATILLAGGGWLAAAAPSSTTSPAQAPSAAALRAEELARHRNLGKAFYENQTTQTKAVEELRQALALAPGSAADRLNYGLGLLRVGKTTEGIAELVTVQKQDPTLPHTWWNLGIAYKQASRNEEARAQLEEMLARVPDDATAHYNLGVLYQILGDAESALRHIETAARLDPDMAAPRYQLAITYRRAGRTDDAARELARFKEIKQEQAKAAVSEDPQWSRYSELLDPIEPRGGGAPMAPVALSMAAGEAVSIEGPPAALPSGLAVLDADGDGKPDLLAWSKGRLLLLAGGARPLRESGLGNVPGVVAAVPGDFDNDGRTDLCVLTATEARLLRNEGGGRFAPVTAPIPAGRYRTAAWLDFDHDYDLDLLLLGDGSALLRNNGDGTWADATPRFPFTKGLALSAAVLDTIASTQGEDLAVSYADRPGVLYRDELGGRYVAEPLPALPAAARALAAADVDGDGWTDLVGAAANGKALLLRNGGSERRLRAGFEALPAPAAASEPILIADLENRGVVDLVASDGVHFGAGRGSFAAVAKPLLPATAAASPLAFAAADFDADGRTDLGVFAGGDVRVLTNRTTGTGRWLRVGLRGVKNLKLAPGTEVELKAGRGYQKQRYEGTPLHFGLARRDLADTVRITWANGLVQNETAQKASTSPTFEEAPRLSGSCPMIFTWDGEAFRFLTDVLGVAPLGASAGDGEYFPVDHDEYVQVPGEALVPVDGRYKVRVTEELREVSYLDQIHLLALDHPAEEEIFTNDKFKGPPFPDFRLFGVRRRIAPHRAVGPRGEDVRELLLAKDGRYPTTFRRDYAGVAEVHTLELDFGAAALGSPANAASDAVLVLSGWVDWADGSTFLGSSQRQGGGLLMPQLQALDEASGEWRTVIEDMGIPAGKPKTIVVDLAGKLPASSRRLRIVTNLCVYWDEIFLAEGAASPSVRLTTLAPASADLRFRGFSTPVIHPLRQQPERFDYQRVMMSTMWNPTPGMYTRYGEVRELLAAVDDLLVVMGSGDEVELGFDATKLPALPSGWRRDFLLLFDGWAKDADANTAFSQTVEPLPFHAMSRYPYPEGERFPDDELHRRWREETLTRPALRLLRPLREAASLP